MMEAIFELMIQMYEYAELRAVASLVVVVDGENRKRFFRENSQS